MISAHAVCSEIDSTQESRNTFSHHLPLGQDEFRFVSDAGRQARKATISTAAAKIIFTTAIAKIIFTTKNNYNALVLGSNNRHTHTQPNTQPNTMIQHTQHCNYITHRTHRNTHKNTNTRSIISRSRSAGGSSRSAGGSSRFGSPPKIVAGKSGGKKRKSTTYCSCPEQLTVDRISKPKQ
jgi:hypothetical protein